MVDLVYHRAKLYMMVHQKDYDCDLVDHRARLYMVVHQEEYG